MAWIDASGWPHSLRVALLSDLVQSGRVKADHPPHLQCLFFFFNQADDFQIGADPEVSR
jgi:hypothetical protein